ncbi:MAG: hypothetical protein KGN36_03570 [Acidobacteriota bacterium]|nr:hypothetical protein [Acidobacteriota bacterium]
MRAGWLLATALCAPAADIPAPPALMPGGIVNSASRMPATLPGGAIARGARFVIPGVRLGPAEAQRGDEADPPSTLGGVSVRLRQGETGVDARLLLVSDTLIEAWAPLDTPLGEVLLTVTWEGRTSEPYRLTIAPSGAGFFTAETAPPPLRAVADAPSAVPGDTVSLWATGVDGPPLEILVGGKPAAAVEASTVASCCRGVRQVRFQVPRDAPLGCFVPVQGRVPGGPSSNVVPIALHAAGEPCHDAVDWLRRSVEQSARAGYLVLARISLDLGPVSLTGSRYRFDYGVASFGLQETGRRLFPPLPPMGTCTLFASRIRLRQMLGQARSPASWTEVPGKLAGNRGLDAGSALVIGGAGKARSLPRDPRRREYYNAILGGVAPFAHDPPKPLVLRKGAYTVRADGGADIGPFQARIEVPGELLWRNRAAIAEVDRAAGVTLEWKPARREDAVLIVAANAERFSGDSAMCLCLAPAADGRFTVPPSALANLPQTAPDSDISASFLLLTEIPVAAPDRIAARGLDDAFAAFVSASARIVKYR